MLNKWIETETLLCFKILSIIRVLPFDFNYKTEQFSVSQSKYRAAFIIFQNVVLLVSPLHAVYLLHWLYENQIGIMAVSSQASTVVSVFSATVFLMDWSTHREDMVLMANRITNFNRKFNGRNSMEENGENKYEDPLGINFFMFHIPPFYVMMVLVMTMFVISFELFENPFNLIGLVPQALKNDFALGLIVVLHMFVSSTRSLCWCFAMIFQGYCFSSLSYWMNRIGVDVPMDYKELDRRIQMYRQLQLIVEHFNERMGVTMVNTKLACSFCGIVSLFNTIKFGRGLTLAQLAFPIWLIWGCVGFPPMLYGRVYRIHTFSLKLKRQALKGINHIPTEGGKSEFRRRVGCLQSSSIRVGNCYFLDRTFSPLFISHAFETTINLLITL